MSWPASAIPQWLWGIAHVFPSTSMIPAFLRIQTMGVDLTAVKPQLIFLMGQMVVYFLLSSLAYRHFARKNAV